MDQEIVLQQLDRLESRITHLVEACKRLEIEKNNLIKEKQELTQQLEERIALQRQQDELKDVIRSKLDSLMGRLDDFMET